jgi:hypothetical protein
MATKKYAVVIDNEIVNVILWSGTSTYKTDGELVCIEDMDPKPGIGWVLENKKWVNPVPTVFPEGYKDYGVE